MRMHVPTGITAEDCRRVRTRNGHLIVWDDSAGNPHIVGKFSAWGEGYRNLSMACRIKGHTKCRRAATIQNATQEQFEVWLLDGADKIDSVQHMGVDFRDAGIHFRTLVDDRMTLDQWDHV